MQTTIGVAKYNMPGSQPAGADYSSAANGAVTTASSNVAQVGVDNPMLWLFGIGAVTLGLIAFSTHVRVGKFSASVTGG